VNIATEAVDTLKVDVDIFVNSNAQQRIVIGEKGRTLVKIRQVT
jgi:GTPase Era involved in 16S rRNA processing